MSNDMYNIIRTANAARSAALGRIVFGFAAYITAKVKAGWSRIINHPTQIDDSFFIGAKSIYDVEALMKDYGKSTSFYQK